MLDLPRKIALSVATLFGTIVWFSLLAILYITPSSAHLFDENLIPILEISLLSIFSATAIGFFIEMLARYFISLKSNEINEFSRKTKNYEQSFLNDAQLIKKSALEVNSQNQIKAVDFLNLQTRDDVRKEFIANLSHELKNPIFNIQSYLLTLIDGVDDKETNHKYLKKANRNVLRMIRLVRDMDVLAHLESNKLLLNKESYDLISQINDVLEQMSERIEQSKIEIVRNYNPNINLNVFADLERMEQVFLNLISNAIKYSDSQGKESFIKITIQDREDLIYVFIEDNGVGISKGDMYRIFERFYRADRSRTQAGKISGTGLGLAIAKHIIEAHGQTIKVTSKLGSGSVFSLSITKPNKQIIT
jgi:two-component system phosphate regulon sensor histidine kinase PhoR